MKLLILIFFVFILPMLLGYPLVKREDSRALRAVHVWCLGWSAIYALVFIPAILCFFLKTSLTVLIVICCLLFLCLSVASVALMIRRKAHPFCGIGKDVRGTTLIGWLAIVLILAHAGLTYTSMHIDDDDIAYIGAATTSVDTDTIMKYDAYTGNLITDLSKNDMDRLVTAPQFLYYAMVSRLTGIRPAALAHSFLPPFFTMLFFGSFAVVGTTLFAGNRRKIDWFVFLTFLISAASYYSVYTAGTFIMVRSWQGKAQVIGLVMPLVLSVLLTLTEKEADSNLNAWVLAVLLAAGCLLSSMAGLLTAMLAGAGLMILVLMRREIRFVWKFLPAFVIPCADLLLYVLL